MRRASSKALWYVGAAALAAVLTVALFPLMRARQPASTATQPSEAPPASAPPPLSANMRENADKLFNRVMQARETGDSTEMARFAPMAVMAYQNSGELDADGLYHLSLLQTVAGDPAASRLTAGQILDRAPSHLLGLAAAAEASVALNDSASARQYYQRFLDALPGEQTRELPEYQDHAGLLAGFESDARKFLGK